MRRRIPVASIKEDLTKGMSDDEIKAKYGLTAEGLSKLLEKFPKAATDATKYIEIDD